MIDEKSGWARAFLGGLAHLWRKSHTVDADGVPLFRSYCGVLVTPTLIQVGKPVGNLVEDGRNRIVHDDGNGGLTRKCGNCERMLDAWRAEVFVPGLGDLAAAKRGAS